jgi:hypothetical protein
MPKEAPMAQLSRPYQIGLVAVALLAAAWLLLLQGHHSSSPESSAAPPPTAAVHAARAHAAASQGSAGQATGHGSASSLGALGHDVEKARGAVATSKQNAHELAAKSAQASTPNTSSSKSSAPAAAPAKSAAPSASASAGTTATAPATSPRVPAGTLRAAAAPRQHLVESQLAQGRTVLIFFWNPKGSDDRSVNEALGRLRHERIAIDRARANAVATFGTITRGIQVYGTPTVLVINRTGRVRMLTGLQDSYTITQAIREVRRR